MIFFFFFLSRSQRQNPRPEVSFNFFPTRPQLKKILNRIYLLVA